LLGALAIVVGVFGVLDSGAPIVNLVRHPAFVQYLAVGDFSEPVIIQSTRESALTLSLQIVPFGVEEKLLMSRDITRLEAVARVRRDFIANVSHELKTPLTVLAGFIETLTDIDMDERQRQRCLALMREQANSMQRLVEDLLTLSALESEQLVNEGEARNADGSCSESQAAGALRAFADDVGGLVKQLDPNHLVGLGTISGECGSNEADYALIHASAPIDLCDYHDYGFPTSPLGNTDPYNGLAASQGRCAADGKAFMVGEMGIHYEALSTPTLAARASLFDAKLAAQFAAGSVGELIWNWSNTASDIAPRDLEITPGDPTLGLLTKY